MNEMPLRFCMNHEKVPSLTVISFFSFIRTTGNISASDNLLVTIGDQEQMKPVKFALRL